MHNPSAPVTEKEREWNQIKGRIIAKYGSVKACAAVVGCAPSSLRVSVLSNLTPGVREKLNAALQQPESLAA